MSLLKKILIKARRQVFTEMVGNNASLFLGEGYDFSELREYQVGDDVRKIDWIISAKLQKPYVKLFHAERELNVSVACMLGGGSFFGTVRSKQEVIAEVMAILGFSAIKNGDLFSAHFFSNDYDGMVRPSKSLYAVQECTQRILDEEPLGKQADYARMAQELYRRIKRKSLLFIVADFFQPVDFAVLAKKHEVILVVVRDRFEENPRALGYASLIDPETGRMVEGEVAAEVVKAYRKDIVEQDRRLQQTAMRQRIRLVKIYTDEEPFKQLAGLFRKGSL